MPAGNGLFNAVTIGSGLEPRESDETFGDRLAGFVERRETQIVLGLDPDPSRLWPHALEFAAGADDLSAPPAVRAARAVAAHCRMLIDAVADHVVAVKPQVACFERLGAPGWQVLAEVVQYTQAAGLLLIADAKRGDVDISASAYGQAFLGETPTPFGPVPGLGADALTVSPWLGADSVEPFIAAARDPSHPPCGVFVLARNSNPGAADLQELETVSGSVSDAAARMIARLGEGGIGFGGIGKSGLSDVGAVVGATAPHRLARLRELMPHTIFLIPGVGAQGGQIEDLTPVFAPGRAAGLVSVSRGIAYAYERDGGEPVDSARREAARLQELAWGLLSPPSR